MLSKLFIQKLILDSSDHRYINMKKEGLVIHIKVEPRSSRSGIACPYGNGLKVRLNAPPVEGKANSELIEILAKAFNIRKKDVEILSGRKSKLKKVRLIGVKSIEDRKYRGLGNIKSQHSID